MQELGVYLGQVRISINRGYSNNVINWLKRVKFIKFSYLVDFFKHVGYTKQAKSRL